MEREGFGAGWSEATDTGPERTLTGEAEREGRSCSCSSLLGCPGPRESGAQVVVFLTCQCAKCGQPRGRRGGLLAVHASSIRLSMRCPEASGRRSQSHIEFIERTLPAIPFHGAMVWSVFDGATALAAKPKVASVAGRGADGNFGIRPHDSINHHFPGFAGG